MEKAFDDSTKEKQIYKVDLYHLLGKSYLFLDYCNDVESLGKILVTVSDEKINPYREKAGEISYKDYKKLDGNHYIDKYYERMQRWEIISNVEEGEEI